MNLDVLSKIICKECDKPVEHSFQCAKIGAFELIVVRCHSKKGLFRIADTVLLGAMSKPLFVIGKAFDKDNPYFVDEVVYETSGVV